ncbi:MAG: DUF5916 domain-containing protein [Candidatus Eremiobacteraeota bacterium]|nr:DUF5916 domain-containing protein [Candidatus Eremiobacteraeota bacterium]
MLRVFVLFVLSTVLLTAGFTAPVAAATTAAGKFNAVPAPHPLTLDPTLSDPAWQLGLLPTADGVENLTTRSAAGNRTTTYLLYDKQNLYVGFKAQQTGTPIVAAQTTNDVGFGLDDFVGIGIDTSGNGNLSYFFETTPRGIRYQQASENARYRPVWQAAGKIDGSSWNAVMIIPLSVLRIGAGSPQNWRINIIRNLASIGEHYSWAFDGIMQDGGIGQGFPSFNDARFWPTLSGLQLSGAAGAARPKPRTDIYVLASGGADRQIFAQSNGSFQQENIRNYGIDLRYPITGTINFVGTLNPDFSNVEIDQQTIAPQEFRRNLQEYRPFFAQGANFINSNAAPAGGISTAPYQIFYSPNIGPFDRGAKVEGSFGKQSFGALSFRGYDQTTGNEFDDIAYGYKHALPDRTFLYWSDGVIAHHSLAGSDNTAEAGVAFRNLKTGFVGALDQSFEQGTYVPAPGFARSFNGFVDVHKPNYEVNLGYDDISPNYNPIDGFTPNSDVRGPSGYVSLIGSARGIKNYNFFAGGDRFLDRSGAIHQADVTANLNLTLNNGITLAFGPNLGYLRTYDIPAGPGCSGPIVGVTFFTGYPCYLNGQTSRFNTLGGAIGYRDGTPDPIDVGYTEGPFGTFYLHQFNAGTSRQFGRISLGVEYDGSFERDNSTGMLNSQQLRRISLGQTLGPDSNVSISLRSINGTGGFAVPGINLAASFHRKFRSGSELFVNYGTPAANATLDRFIVKYLFRFGGE